MNFCKIALISTAISTLILGGCASKYVTPDENTPQATLVVNNYEKTNSILKMRVNQVFIGVIGEDKCSETAIVKGIQSEEDQVPVMITADRAVTVGIRHTWGSTFCFAAMGFEPKAGHTYQLHDHVMQDGCAVMVTEGQGDDEKPVAGFAVSNSVIKEFTFCIDEEK